MKSIAPAILSAIDEAFAFLPKPMDTRNARVMIYTTGLQESLFEYRRQVVEVIGRGGKVELRPTGPAKSFYQFERGGGCKGVIQHDASRYWMHQACQWRGVEFNPTALWNAIENDDVLATCAARLLYFTDPKKLPDASDEEGGWKLYTRTWRPGALLRQRDELRQKWARNHAQVRAMA